MAPPYTPGYLARSLVRVPGSGRDGPRATILCDLSRVSTLAATVPMPRNLPPALVSLPSGLPDNTLQNPHLRRHNPREGEYNASSPPSLQLQTSTAHTLNGSSGPRKRTRDQVFRGDETYPKSKVSKLEDAPLPPRPAANVGANVTSSNRGSTITPAVVVFIPQNQMHQFISASQPQEGSTQTPQVLVSQLQDSPASLGTMAQLQGLFQQSSPTSQGVMAHLQSLLQHARPAPQGVVAHLQSLLQQANPAPQRAVAQVQSLLQQSNTPIQKVAAPQPSTPVPQIVVAPRQNYVQQSSLALQTVVLQQNHVQQTNPASQKVVVPHQNHLQQTNPTPQKVVVPHQNHLQQTNQSPHAVQMQQTIKQLVQNISQPSTLEAISMTEVAEESRKLREHNLTLRRQVSLFQQLFSDKQRLVSVIRKLGMRVA